MPAYEEPGLETGLVGVIGDLSDKAAVPAVECKGWVCGWLCWTRPQHPLVCMGDGDGGGTD